MSKNERILALEQYINVLVSESDKLADELNNQDYELKKMHKRIEALEAPRITNATPAAEPGRFGPQTVEVESLIARIRTLTNTEAEALSAERVAALDAAWGAARVAARVAACDEALCAARVAARVAVRDEARVAVQGAALGLIVRDLIGQHGYTQDHYDTLTEPWATTIGKAHPDDPDRMPKTEHVMAEPQNVGAIVVDASGDKWVRVLGNNSPWIHMDGMVFAGFSEIINPQPFQNVSLTAADPEPPLGSVVLGSDGIACQRKGSIWVSGRGWVYDHDWAGFKFPVTLIYRGEETK